MLCILSRLSVNIHFGKGFLVSENSGDLKTVHVQVESRLVPKWCGFQMFSGHLEFYNSKSKHFSPVFEWSDFKGLGYALIYCAM